MENTGLALKFLYDGVTRHVDNVTIEADKKCIIGYEMRKAGKFSYKIKRYSYDKIYNMEQIPSFERSGPVIGIAS